MYTPLWREKVKGSNYINLRKNNSFFFFHTKSYAFLIMNKINHNDWERRTTNINTS